MFATCALAISEEMREKPVKKSIRWSLNSRFRAAGNISGSNRRLPFCWKWIKFKPPCAAAAWSWEPTFSRRTSCSMRIASAASHSELTRLPCSAVRECKSPTTKDELEPKPERAGRSASQCISSPRSWLSSWSTARIAGCCISAISFAFSTLEYAMRYLCSKKGGSSRQVI